MVPNSTIYWHTMGLIGSQLTLGKGPLQDTHWKLAAALQRIFLWNVNYTRDQKIKSLLCIQLLTYQAEFKLCLCSLYAQAGDEIQVSFYSTSQICHIQCTNCHLHHCTNKYYRSESIIIMYQPTAISVPVNLKNQWEQYLTIHITYYIPKDSLQREMNDWFDYWSYIYCHWSNYFGSYFSYSPVSGSSNILLSIILSKIHHSCGVISIQQILFSEMSWIV